MTGLYVQLETKDGGDGFAALTSTTPIQKVFLTSHDKQKNNLRLNDAMFLPLSLRATRSDLCPTVGLGKAGNGESGRRGGDQSCDMSASGW